MCKTYPTDVVFVIDSSKSLSKKYFNIAKDYMKTTITNQWEISLNHFQIAVVSYAETAKIELEFNETLDKTTFDHFVSQIPFRGGISEIHKGLILAKNMLINRKRSANKYIILLSDGFPSPPRSITSPDSSGIKILAVAVGEDISHHFLSKVAGGKDRLFTYNTDKLWHFLINDLVLPSCNSKNICCNYVL